MELHGQHIIGAATSAEGNTTFNAQDPATGQPIEPAFHKTTEAEINRAMESAQQAFEVYRCCSGEQRAAFIEAST